MWITSRKTARSRNWTNRRETKLVFLHVPKTGGQSVRQMLSDAFGEQAICPARSNEELCTYSIRELNSYRVHAPHGDWSMLDAIEGDKIVFTVLRRPIDRILSYYFFVLDKAKRMTAQDRALPHHQGLNAVHEMTPDAYFFEGAPHLRAFLDDTYDNFYTYYFGTRRWDGRRRLRNLMQRGLYDEERAVAAAMKNIERLDRVFLLDELPQLAEMLSEISGRPMERDYRVNVNEATPPEARLERLRQRGASEAVFKRLAQFSALDDRIWATLLERRERVQRG